jgi:hypothetical protein
MGFAVELSFTSVKREREPYPPECVEGLFCEVQIKIPACWGARASGFGPIVPARAVPLYSPNYTIGWIFVLVDGRGLASTRSVKSHLVGRLSSKIRKSSSLILEKDVMLNSPMVLTPAVWLRPYWIVASSSLG